MNRREHLLTSKDVPAIKLPWIRKDGQVFLQKEIDSQTDLRSQCKCKEIEKRSKRSPKEKNAAYLWEIQRIWEAFPIGIRFPHRGYSIIAYPLTGLTLYSQPSVRADLLPEGPLRKFWLAAVRETLLPLPSNILRGGLAWESCWPMADYNGCPMQKCPNRKNIYNGGASLNLDKHSGSVALNSGRQ